MMRKIIQIAICEKTDEYPKVLALCDDGTLWFSRVDTEEDVLKEWKLLKRIPQDDE